MHKQGVEETAHLLLHECEEWQDRQPAAGRKQQHHKGAAHASQHHTVLPALLSVAALNSFFGAAVDVVNAIDSSTLAGEEDAAATATAALQVAQAVFAKQLLAVQLAEAGHSSGGAGPAAGPGEQQPQVPDAVTYALLCQLYGAAGQYSMVASIVIAAVKQQLPLAASSSSKGDALQVVLYGAAAAWQAAGCSSMVCGLLDGLVSAGVMCLSHPCLQAAVLAASNTDEQVRERGCT